MAAPAVQAETTQQLYGRLMAARRGDPVEETLACMLASWATGVGSMPDWLGLGEAGFYNMLRQHFPQFDITLFENPGRPVDRQRLDEMQDLHKLLMQNRSGRSAVETCMAEIVIAGCLGNDHLWQDLGLWQRADLSKLMLDNFAPLAKRNDKDMKWKKFLYKQLCETEGIYTCRSPSCEVCADYANCFGPEE
ncbi:MAG: nitrogen fixation protein NifQ [Chromatiales bacterium]|jgi:nitrogen fixation protein NifQ